MRKNRTQPRDLWLTAFSVFNLVILLLIWLAEDRFSERCWPILLLISVPPLVFALAPLLLLVVSLVRRHHLASLLNLGAALFALFGLLGFRFDIHPHHSRERPLRVMTYNVEKWSHGADAVAAVVSRVQPDVFCLQEAGDYPYVRGRQPLILQQHLSQYHFLRRGEMTIASRFPIVREAEAALPPGPASRPALAAVIKTPQGMWTVLTVHLIPCEIDRHLTDGTLSQYSRQFAQDRDAQDTALLDFAAHFPASLVICGDFNAQPQTRFCRRLTHRYPDAFDLAGRGFGYTVPASWPMMRIDHLLLGNGLTAQRVWVPAVQASDHRPLVAEVAFDSFGTRH